MAWMDKLKRAVLPLSLRDAGELESYFQRYRNTMDKGERSDDPAERLSAALRVSGAMNTIRKYIKQSRYDRSDEVSGAIFFAGVIGGVLLASMLAPVITTVGAVILGASSVAVGVTELTCSPVGKHVQKKMLAKVSAASQQFSELETRANGVVGSLLEKQTVEIAASEKFNAIYDEFPGVRDHFNKAFNHAAARQALLAVSPPAKPQPGKSLQL